MFDARGDAGARPRLLPRLRLAGGRSCCAASASRRASCRATRSSSSADVKPLDGPGGRRARTSPTCTPGPRSTCPAPAGSASTPPAACWPARGTSRSPAPPGRRRPRAITGSFAFDAKTEDDKVEEEFDLRDARPAHRRDAARHQALPRGPVGGDRRAGRAGRPRSRAARRPADDGRRADLRLDRRSRRARVEHRRARADGKRTAGRPAAAAAARAVRAGRAAAPRPGQVVPGRAAAALGATPATSAATASRSGATRRCSRERADPARRRPTRAAAQGSCAALAERLGVGDRAGAAGLRGRLLLPLARAPPARRTSTCWRAGSTIRSSARGWRACSARAWARSPATSLPLRARATCERARRLGERPLVAARRAPVPVARRLADGLPAAARRPALGAGGGAEPIHERDPLAAAPAAADGRCRADGPAPQAGQRRRRDTPTAPTPRSVVRTALCVEPREGMLHVFMPPVELARGVPGAGGRHRGRRRASASSRCASRATTPPTDHRLDRLSVTPDPGVIEVNVHPTRTWRDLAEMTDGALRRGARSAGSAPRSSCSTGATPAPAAATTSCWAAPTPGRQPVPAPARSAAQPGRLLRQPPVAVVPVLGHVRRAHQPGAAHRRGPPGHHPRAGAGVRARCRREGRRPALAGRSDLPPPAGRRHRQHPPHRDLHRQALQPGQRQRAPGAGRAARLRDAAARAHEPHAAALARARWSPGSGARRTAARRCAGGPASSIASRCPTSWSRTSTTCSTICAAPATRSPPTGSAPTASSASRWLGSDRRRRRRRSSCGRPSSPGTCSARSRRAAAPPATSTRRSSASR